MAAALTRRELQSLRMAAEGMSSREIAEVLGVKNEQSIRRLWSSAAAKLGADNTIHAVYLACRRKLIS